jgi:hypothetical protein
VPFLWLGGVEGLEANSPEDGVGGLAPNFYPFSGEFPSRSSTPPNQRQSVAKTTSLGGLFSLE